MRSFTDERDADTEDELWICEHPSVYTLGQAGRVEHIHNSQNIPVVKSDRGGQVTYHGPGQLIVYTLVNLRRKSLGVRNMVMLLEQAVIDVLQQHGIVATARRDAPGVYVEEAKIAALGLRVRKGCTYHGLSFNVDVDLAPYAGIDPCGYQGLEVTSTQKLGILADKKALTAELLAALHTQLDVTVETRTS